MCIGHVAITVASSGIATLLLEGGRTAHSVFKIPIALGRDSMCSIPVQNYIQLAMGEHRFRQKNANDFHGLTLRWILPCVRTERRVARASLA